MMAKTIGSGDFLALAGFGSAGITGGVGASGAGGVPGAAGGSVVAVGLVVGCSSMLSSYCSSESSWAFSCSRIV